MTSATAVAPARPRARGRGRALSRMVGRWSVFVLCVLGWQLATAGGTSPFFPTPAEIAGTAWRDWFSGPPQHLFLTSAAFHDVLPSLGRLLLGCLLAAVLGVALGMLLGRSRTALAYLGALLAFARSIPPTALVPVFLVLFHLGFQMQLAVIVFGTIWPILLNTAEGARGVDDTKRDTARVFRVPRTQWLGQVVLPNALPQIFAGVRISLSLGLVLMVVAELMGSSDGIGHAMQVAKDEFSYTQLWAGIVLLGVVGYCLNALLLVVERRVLGSRPT